MAGEGCGRDDRGTAVRSLGPPGESSTGWRSPQSPEEVSGSRPLGRGSSSPSTGRRQGERSSKAGRGSWARLGSYHGDGGGGAHPRAPAPLRLGLGSGEGEDRPLRTCCPLTGAPPTRLLPRWRPRATSPTGNGAGQRAGGGAPWGGETVGAGLHRRLCQGGLGARPPTWSRRLLSLPCSSALLVNLRHLLQFINLSKRPYHLIYTMTGVHKGLVARIYKELLKFNNGKTTNSIFKWLK